MAPLPDNNTACLWVDYNNGWDDHSLQVRYAGAANFADAVAAAVGLFSELEPVMYLTTILGVRYRSAGSTIALPNTWPGAATYGAFLMPREMAPRAITFLGRSTDGRRVSWSLYVYNGNTPGTYRIAAGAVGEIDAAIAHIDTVSNAGPFCTVSGDAPTMYPYASVNYNSYWEAEQRG